MRSMESGDFLSAWAGISGLQFALPATWTGARARNHSVVELARWWSEGPARLCGQWASKGSLKAGKMADFVVWEPDSIALTDQIHHRHAGSAYAGRRDLRGLVVRTRTRAEVRLVRMRHVCRLACACVGSSRSVGVLVKKI